LLVGVHKLHLFLFIKKEGLFIDIYILTTNYFTIYKYSIIIWNNY